MDTLNLAPIAEASNILLGLDRKLSKVQEEPKALPLQSPIVGVVQDINSGFGETTRQRRNVVFSDGGWNNTQKWFDSTYQYIQGPVCDARPTDEMFGGSSRLDGRSPMLRRTT